MTMTSGFRPPQVALDRRNFIKLSAAAGGGAAVASSLGFGLGASSASQAAPTRALGGPYDIDPETGGEWRTAACWHNCSCDNARCLIQVLLVDGVPQRIRTDSQRPDSPEMPQYRACARGRSQVQHILAANRIKYPMIRKGWEPGGGNKELRGRDEWRRASWDEALDLAAAEMKRIYTEHGPNSVFYSSWCPSTDSNGLNHWDPMSRVFNRMGGSVQNTGTVSFGAWPLTETLMLGTNFGDVNDRTALMQAKLIVLVGANWAANKAGNASLFLQTAKDAGARLVIIDPWLNRTAAGLADQWIPIRPGTDTAFWLGMAHHMITHGLQDQAFLDRYCIGFDAEHMPERADPRDNFKDYVLGTYDGEPKTPEWASAKCGVDARVIRQLANEIATTKPASFYAGMSTSKIPAGEQWSQVFYTVGWMTGNVGKPGATVAWQSPEPYTAKLIKQSGYGDPDMIPNPIRPKWITYGVRDLHSEGHWDMLDDSEAWEAILTGEYGRDSWPGGKRQIDIRMMYHGYRNILNSFPSAMKGIEAIRKVDFVLSSNIFYNANAQYADIVFPVHSWWERPYGQVISHTREQALYWQPIMKPLFESRMDLEVAVGLAERLGLDADVVMGNPWQQKEFNTVANATVTVDKQGPKPLVTITEKDIQEWGVEGKPQQGTITLAEFRRQGVYSVPRKFGDELTYIASKAFIDNPEANPLKTESGKFEIYCRKLAAIVNEMGYDQISPIGKYQEAQPDHGWHARTDEYPLILYTPHSLRRAHTVLDQVGWLRKAFHQECFMSVVDAEERGLRTNDTVLLTSPHGKMYRRVKVMDQMTPGVVAVEDGGWLDIDDDGIDHGGCPNVLQAPKPAGQGLQAFGGTLVQVERAPITIDPDYMTEMKLPQGVE